MKTAVAAVVLMGAFPAFGDPVFGSWTLKPGDAAYSCYVTRLDDLGNGKFHVTSVAVRAGSETVRQDAVLAFDSAAHPDGLGNTAMVTRIDERRYAVVTVSGDKTRVTAMRTIAADGGTMSETANGMVAGKPFARTLHFERRESRCGD